MSDYTLHWCFHSLIVSIIIIYKVYTLGMNDFMATLLMNEKTGMTSKWTWIGYIFNESTFYDRTDISVLKFSPHFAE